MSSQSLTILITGAASGLGRGLAVHFAGKGHRVILVDLNAEALKETMQLLGPNASRASSHTVDISSGAQVKTLFDSLGPTAVDVLINNAGIQFVAPVTEYPEERWDVLMDVMLKGPFLLTKAALPAMRQKGFGRIINIGSFHSLVASPFKTAYTAAKHGLLGFAKSAALETANTDITVNTICPGYMRTPLVDAQIRSQAKVHNISEEDVINKIMLEPMPKKVFITTEEIAATIEFLISREARNITGQAITIDGGWTSR
jgi:3-hydroxybutyrate dehydrogenase